MESYNPQLLQFISACPDCYHTVATLSQTLEEAGYQPLSESEAWQLVAGGKYYVTRNQSSLIAFRVPSGDWQGFMLTASHSDSPTFKIKPEPLMPVGGYLKLNTEKYGGMILETWMDRPLSLSGRVLLQTKDGITSRLLHIDRDLLVIPTLAPHLTTSADGKAPLNPQTDLLPLFAQGETGTWAEFLAKELTVTPEEILDTDLFLYPRMSGSIWGEDQVFISAPRLDDLLCVFASLQGFLTGNHARTLPLCCVFDNEEVGSGTKQGAKSTFLQDVLSRIGEALGRDMQQQLADLKASMMLSCDNGHALHPNHPEKSDPTHCPTLNGGVLLKYNANQRYTTDGVSAALLRRICQHAEIPVQTYVNRSDIPGGSTLGNLSSEKVSINTADIGVAQLAMHSTWETAGAKDTAYLIDAIQAFYSTAIIPTTDGSYMLDWA